MTSITDITSTGSFNSNDGAGVGSSDEQKNITLNKLLSKLIYQVNETNKSFIHFSDVVKLNPERISEDKTEELLALIDSDLDVEIDPFSLNKIVLHKVQEILAPQSMQIIDPTEEVTAEDEQPPPPRNCRGRTIHEWKSLSSMGATIYAVISAALGPWITARYLYSGKNTNLTFAAVSTGATLGVFTTLFLVKRVFDELANCYCCKKS